MRILVACEESQAVCKELRKLGHEAYSCDIQECSGGGTSMAFKSRCFGTPENEMGYDYSFPTLHIFNKRRSKAFMGRRKAEQRTIQKRIGSQGVFYEVL